MKLPVIKIKNEDSGKDILNKLPFELPLGSSQKAVVTFKDGKRRRIKKARIYFVPSDNESYPSEIQVVMKESVRTFPLWLMAAMLPVGVWCKG